MCVKDIAGIESALWLSFYLRIQGLPNIGSLIFLLFPSFHSPLPPTLFSSKQHCQVSQFYEKADCHIGLTGPFEEELQKLPILLFYHLNSNEVLHYKIGKAFISFFEHTVQCSWCLHFISLKMSISLPFLSHYTLILGCQRVPEQMKDMRFLSTKAVRKSV